MPLKSEFEIIQCCWKLHNSIDRALLSISLPF